MKIELSERDMELLLFLLGNTLISDFDTGKPLVFSIEELALIEKLEKALRKYNQVKKDFDFNPRNLSH